MALNENENMVEFTFGNLQFIEKIGAKVAFLLLHPAAPGLILCIPKSFIRDVGEI